MGGANNLFLPLGQLEIQNGWFIIYYYGAIQSKPHTDVSGLLAIISAEYGNNQGPFTYAF